MIMFKVVGGILAALGIIVVLYFGFIGFLPTPTQVRADITSTVTK